MGLFGFLADLTSAAVKTVIVAPVAVVRDVVALEPFEKTGEVLESAVEDVEDAFDELLD